MEFNLKKPIVFFDVEATGLSVVRDRIIQIALVKYLPGQNEPEELTLLINPGAVLISEEAYQVHGISNKDLSNKPTFDQVAQKIYDFIGDSDLGGYNSNRFDIPLLMEEFDRVGLEFDTSKRNTVDVQRIFYKMEPRTLRAALKFYCQKNMRDAHDALADVRATVDVLKGQLKMYQGVDLVQDEVETVKEPVKNDMEALHRFTNDLKTIDATQKMKYNAEGTIVFNFGKYANQPVAKVLYEDRNYYNWILNIEFTSQVKQLVKRLFKDYERDMQKKKLSLLGCLLICCSFFYSCFESNVGCLDIEASNFDFAADEDCCDQEETCCCNYPSLSLDVLHKLNPDSIDNFSLNAFYPWPVGQGEFSVNSFNLYLSHFSYKDSLGNDFTNADVVELSVLNDDGVIEDIEIQDNFALIKPNIFTYNIGEIRGSGSFNMIDFYIGIPEPEKNGIPESLPEGHPLSKQDPCLQFSANEGYLTCQVSIKKDTFAITNPDTFNLTTTELFSTMVDNPLNVENGDDLTINLRISYLNLFEGIDFAIDNDAQIIQKLTTNLPNVINIEE